MEALFHFLGHIDTWLFLIINQKFHAHRLDIVMKMLSNPGWLMLLPIAFWFYLIFRRGKRGRYTAILVAISLAITDPVSVRLVKPLVDRPRPNNPDYFISNGRYLQGYNGSRSYPSAHAANMFGVAGVLAYAYPAGKVFWFILAAGVGYSRIYLGQHYPLDVLGGAVLGLLTASVIFQILLILKKEDTW